MATAQQTWFAYQANRNKQRSGGDSDSGISFSEEAQAAFAIYDSIGDGLTTQEKTCMATYIDAQVLSGNQALRDYHRIGRLSGKNARVDYIGGKLALNTGEPVLTKGGFNYNGVDQHGDCVFKPSTDAVNASLNNECYSIFITENFQTGAIVVYAAGAVNAAVTAQTILAQKPSTNEVRISTQHASASTKVTTEIGGLQNDTYYEAVRTASNREDLYKDGVSIGNASTAAVALADANLFSGARNFAGAADYTNVTIASEEYGAAVGRDHVGANADLRELFTCLDAITDREYFFAERQIFANTEDFAFSTDGTNLFWSTDGGDTWINEYAWGTQFTGGLPVPAKYITMAWIFSDGTLIFSTYANIYRSTNGLVGVSEITPTGYTLHTPSNAIRPGNYYQVINNDEPQIMGAVEMRVWGNYGNTLQAGGVPSLVWYTIDKGATIKKAFEFGQNPYMTDNGGTKGEYGGTLLGDATEATKIRHIHSCVFDGTDSWYVWTGDESPRDNQAETIEEIHVVKLTYNDSLDTWTDSVIHSDSNSLEKERYKATGVNIIGTDIYWGSDATAAVAGGSEVGIFKSSIADINTPANHIRLLDFTPDSVGGAAYRVIDMKIDPISGFMVIIIEEGVSGFGGKVITATNFGASGTYTIIDTKTTPSISWAKIFPKNADGYFKIDQDYVWLEQKQSFFIKEV